MTAPALAPTSDLRAPTAGRGRKGHKPGQKPFGPMAVISVAILVVLAVLGRQQQHGGPHVLGPERGDDVVPVASRQHDVEHDRVVVAPARTLVAGGPVVLDVDREPLGHEPALDRAREGALVVDHQDAHVRKHRTGRSRGPLPRGREHGAISQRFLSRRGAQWTP